ncbi:TnsD family transposase [Heyndrickxia sporothermodurans]|uniref:TnsD family transposase n=1 Tax=Heyndrickxia sporothermodurans TaxID=46224 RepID=UPI002E1D9F70|nr:TnsD family transposase [Heyndrickxia sporothermodurans]MED3700155.1 TnsD family transposase [Heyndrickxia sporothermodurans]MED3779719.1 TnsD family transposase [Heyndrickxia sporothermodurans]
MGLLFFNTPYPDELFYSICARFHKRSGNIHEKATIEDLFSSRSITASAFLPSGINALIANLPPFAVYTAEQFIVNHTLYPFYTAFLSPKQAEQVYKSMLSNDGKDIYVRSGINASDIPQVKFFRFCKQCFESDMEKYGEPYFHRFHQVSGIECCLEHYTPLYNSSVLTSGGGKHRFEFPTTENCVASENTNVLNSIPEAVTEKYIVHLKELVSPIRTLLNKRFVNKELQWFGEKYTNALISKGLAYYSQRVKQDDWREFFLEKYDPSVLGIFHSSITGKGDWLSMIVQKHRKSFHPIRHLLVMSALEMSVEELFNEEITSPFVSPPWACLNPVCDFYKQDVINSMDLTLSDNTKNPIGTFTCPHCKYTYTRRGPDKSEADRNRKTRVKSYGPVWEEKLKEQSQLDTSLRELSRKMGADPNTIKRYLTTNKKEKIVVNEAKLSVDQKTWLGLIGENPNKSVKQLRMGNKALYMRLYRANREWLGMNSPILNQPSNKERIDWSKRDNEILDEVVNVINELLNEDQKPIRITLSKLGSMIGKKALLEKKLYKLPKTKLYLEKQLESVSDFQIRRIEYVLNKMKTQGEVLPDWRILRMAGLPYEEKWVDVLKHFRRNR